MGAGSTLLEYGDRMVRGPYRNCCTPVRDEVRCLHGYVQTCWTWTRIGSPDFQLKRDWVDLADLVESARRRLDSSRRQHKLLVHLISRSPGSMCTVP